VTTRGMKEKEMAIIADFIWRALNDVENELVLKSVADDVRELCKKFPVYPHRLGK
jgi:glycine hydroxymethyltransferase